MPIRFGSIPHCAALLRTRLTALCVLLGIPEGRWQGRDSVHHAGIPSGTPPILLAHASDDDEKAGGSNVENSVIMYLALRRANVPTEMHIYASGNHDFGVRENDKLTSSWPQLALRWLRSMNLLSAGSI